MGQHRIAGQHIDMALDRREVPWQSRRYRRVEFDANARVADREVVEEIVATCSPLPDVMISRSWIS